MDASLLIHPGEILRDEFLEPHGLTPSMLASRLGLPANRITTVVNGERGVTPETAVLLGEAFGTTAEFWLNLQRRYDLDSVRDDIAADRLEGARQLHRDLRTANMPVAA